MKDESGNPLGFSLFAMLGVLSLSSAMLSAGRASSMRAQAASDPSSRDQDAALLDGMWQRGDDLARATEVDFYLYVPHKSDAVFIADRFRRRRFRCEVRPPTGPRSGSQSEGTDWLVYAVATHVLSLEYLQSTEREFTRALKPFGGIYDGWEAVDPRPPATR